MRRKQNSQLPQTPKGAFKMLADNILNSFDIGSLCFVDHLRKIWIYADDPLLGLVLRPGDGLVFNRGSLTGLGCVLVFFPRLKPGVIVIKPLLGLLDAIFCNSGSKADCLHIISSSINPIGV